jgi:GNAT superfamily N-acetyltransferase
MPSLSVATEPTFRALVDADAAALASLTAVLGETEPPATRRADLAVGAEVNGALVAYAVAHVTQGAFGVAGLIACIERVGVHPAWQGRHIARRLAEALLETLAHEGVHHVFTLVTARDDRLQPFFRSLGFRPSTLVCVERRV